MNPVNKPQKCPHCHSKKTTMQDSYSKEISIYYCEDCDDTFEVRNHRNRGRTRRYDDADENGFHYDTFDEEEKHRW